MKKGQPKPEAKRYSVGARHELEVVDVRVIMRPGQLSAIKVTAVFCRGMGPREVLRAARRALVRLEGLLVEPDKEACREEDNCIAADAADAAGLPQPDRQGAGHRGHPRAGD